MKRLLMIVAAVAVLGLAAVAVGGAATSAQEGDGPLGTFLSKVAEKLGVSEDQRSFIVLSRQLEQFAGRISRTHKGPSLLSTPWQSHDGSNPSIAPAR